MPTITDLPIELFVDSIFDYLPVDAILSLGCTNRFFAQIAADEPFWHRRIQQDFNFSGADTARHEGWKFLYRRLANPKLYVWGYVSSMVDPMSYTHLQRSREKSVGRLGLADTPKTSVRDGVPYPIRLDIPGVRIVSLVAGGM